MLCYILENNFFEFFLPLLNIDSDPGKILDDKLTIACSEQSIKILEIQKEGKNKQSTDQFLLGNKIKQGKKII